MQFGRIHNLGKRLTYPNCIVLIPIALMPAGNEWWYISMHLCTGTTPKLHFLQFLFHTHTHTYGMGHAKVPYHQQQ
jgi:hypothetical protein